MEQPSFFKNISLRIIYTIPLRFRGLIVLPFLTRIYSPEIVGVWLQVMLLSTLLPHILCLRLEAALIRYLFGENNPKSIIQSVYTISLLFCLIFLSFIVLFGHKISVIVFGNEHMRSVLMIASIWIVIKTCIHIGLSVFRAREQIGILSVREFISTAWMITAVCVSYNLKLDINILILLCLIGDAIILLWVLTQIGTPLPVISIRTGFFNIKKYLKFSTPLIFSSFFLWITRSIDRFLILHLIGLGFVGVYGVNFQVASLIFMVLRPINFVLFPRASGAWNIGDRQLVDQSFSQAVSFTLILSIPIIIGLFVISEGLIGLFAGEEYFNGFTLILFLLLSCLASMIYQNHLYVTHLVEKTHWLPVLFISTALFNLITGYALILKFELIGAALARLSTLMAMAIFVTIFARKHVSFNINWSLIARVTIASLLMGVLINWIPTDSWGQLLLKVVSGVTIFALFLVILRVATKKNLMALKSQF
jgi:O-antigen/teichoic acid export membrane protein